MSDTSTTTIKTILENFVKFIEEKNHGMMFVDEYLKRMIPEFLNTSQPTITEEAKMDYIKCNLPTECENLSKGMYCPDKCKIEGCTRDSSIPSNNDTKR